MTPGARLRAGLVVLLGAHAACAAAPTCSVPLSGTNVAGGEFNPGKPDAVHGRDYLYPGPAEIGLMTKLGLKLMRVPFAWERLQPEPGGELEAAELGRLDAVVASARRAGLRVVLDAHNYGSYRGRSLAADDGGSAALPDLWKRLALHYADQVDIVFGIMNEPHDIAVDRWATIAAATLASIRSTGARNIVLVPGTRWDGAHSWLSTDGGRSNADALLPLASRDERVVFEVHQYFDDDHSGTSEACGAASQVPAILSRVGAWARSHRVMLMLGEFGVSQRPACVKALDDALAVVETDRDVWFGWTYWAAGAWWGSYPFNIQSASGDTPQGRVLHAHAAALDHLGCRP